MAHPQQIEYCKRIKLLFPDYFRLKKVLDCGSYDVNGNNKYLFENCNYTGIDVQAGPNVNVVSKIHEYNENLNNQYDTIISTECFEHDMYFDLSINRIIQLLKPDGLFVFTCATKGRKEHGTLKNMPDASPATIKSANGWENYYRNIDASEILPIGWNNFQRFAIEVNKNSYDVYFWGKNKMAR